MQAAKDWFGAYRIRFTATMAWMSPLSVTDWGRRIGNTWTQ